MASDKKTILKTEPEIHKKIWDFSSMRPGNKSTRKKQKGKVLKKRCFEKN